MLPSEARAADLARGYVRELCLELPAETREDLLVIVSELVTNAVLHGRPAIVLRLRLTPSAVGVSVQDAGEADFEMPSRNPGPREDRGRGLLIVNGLASEWGVERHQPPPGKTVWFELNAP